MGLELTDISYFPSGLCSCHIKLFKDRLSKKKRPQAPWNPVMRSFSFTSGFCHLGRLLTLHNSKLSDIHKLQSDPGKEKVNFVNTDLRFTVVT